MCFRPADASSAGLKCPECGTPVQPIGGITPKNCPACHAELSPGAPGAPMAPGAPGAPAAPGAPGAPKAPGVPGAPGAPKPPGAPGTN